MHYSLRVLNYIWSNKYVQFSRCLPYLPKILWLVAAAPASGASFRVLCHHSHHPSWCTISATTDLKARLSNVASFGCDVANSSRIQIGDRCACHHCQLLVALLRFRDFTIVKMGIWNKLSNCWDLRFYPEKRRTSLKVQVRGKWSLVIGA